MPDTTLRLEIDGTPVGADRLDRVLEVQAEEATDRADAATVSALVEPGPDGEWRSLLDPLATPRTPLVVELERGGVSYRFDGLSTQASWELDPDGRSRMTVKALDRTLELDSEEKVVAWPGTSDSGIAESIFADHGLRAHAESTPAAPDPDVHVVLQRATDWGFLRSLAAKWGYSVYLESEGGRTVGHFHPLEPLADPQGELLLGFGGQAGRARVEADLTGGQRVKAARIPVLSDAVDQGEAAGDDEAQGERSLAAQTTLLLSPADLDGEVEALAAATGLARSSAFAVRLNVDVDAAQAGMLRARRTVLVKGLGSALSGPYLVERVRHRVELTEHRLELGLARNALGRGGLL
jgi:hypothetical protein